MVFKWYSAIDPIYHDGYLIQLSYTAIQAPVPLTVHHPTDPLEVQLHVKINCRRTTTTASLKPQTFHHHKVLEGVAEE